MRYENENIWLTQKMMAALYSVSVQNVGQNIKKVFEDGELSPDSVIKKFFITATDGKDYETMHYNLQMIIAVGFKVNNLTHNSIRPLVVPVTLTHTANPLCF